MAVIAIAIPKGPGRTTGDQLVEWLRAVPWVAPACCTRRAARSIAAGLTGALRPFSIGA